MNNISHRPPLDTTYYFQEQNTTATVQEEQGQNSTDAMELEEQGLNPTVQEEQGQNPAVQEKQVQNSTAMDSETVEITEDMSTLTINTISTADTISDEQFEAFIEHFIQEVQRKYPHLKLTPPEEREKEIETPPITASTAQVQKAPLYLNFQPHAYHYIILGTTEPQEQIDTAHMVPIKNIIDKLNTPELGSKWAELLDIEYDLNLARKYFPNNDTRIEELESEQIRLLKLSDDIIEKMKFGDMLKPFPTTGMLRCLTWLAKQGPTVDENVLAPFFTCILAGKVHIMLYNVLADYKQNTTLKAVVGNYLCEIPFNISTPDNLPANWTPKVAVVLLPQLITAQDGTDKMTGVKVMLWAS